MAGKQAAGSRRRVFEVCVVGADVASDRAAIEDEGVGSHGNAIVVLVSYGDGVGKGEYPVVGAD